MKLSGWGRYPSIDVDDVFLPRSIDDIENRYKQARLNTIARGNARSYGDSALSNNIIQTTCMDHLIAFNESTGLLTCESGILLRDIVRFFLPRGWFPSVTPGTQLITIGGAVASDVHGKNHHNTGCFSSCVDAFQLMLPDGQIMTCSRQQNAILFHATCGGMGLTGIILTVSFYLKKVSSSTIKQTTIKTKNLDETLKAFEHYADETYSVAWIDCLSKNDQIGRSLLMVGDFNNNNDYSYIKKKDLPIPFELPSFTLNRWSVKLFNNFFYRKTIKKVSYQQVSIDSFFYPLDSIAHWNRIYGKNGFIQYQFILPKVTSKDGLDDILKRISTSGMASFLAVLKLYGPENDNWLSFPLNGYSLALDFKLQNGLLTFLETLDQVVTSYGGRIYLAKDSTMSQTTFNAGYPNADRFRQLRKELGVIPYIHSRQSQRLGL